MNEKEMIEELSHDIIEDENETIMELSRHLVAKGYRKIPEGSVVLSKEELNDLEYKAYSRGVCLVCEKVDEQKEKARKETAKEILGKIKKKRQLNAFYNDCKYAVIWFSEIDEIAKQFSVEVEE